MSFLHRIYILVLTLIVVVVTGMIILSGISYYNVPIEERFFHGAHKLLKPSGDWGHGFGIAGSVAMLLGVVLYIARKRMRSLARWGILRHWLEFHIFLCTLGPILVLFHTSFKFGGLVAVSFWSMVAVFASGVIGRFIYIQIPRTIEGRELSLNEVREMKTNIGSMLTGSYHLDEESCRLIMDSTKNKADYHQQNFLVSYFIQKFTDLKTITQVRKVLKKNQMAQADRKKILSLVKHDIVLNRRIDRLNTMQSLFKYWHVVHLPFAFVMLIIMIIHVAVTITFGYHWIF